MGVRLADAIVYFKSDDKELKSGFSKAEADTKSWAGRMGSAVKTAATGVMVAGAAAATTAIVGIGKAAFSVSSDTRAAANDMAASLGIPTEEAQRFAAVARDVYRNNFAKDVRDAGEAVAEVARQMKLAASDPSLQSITEKAIGLRDVFGADIQESITTAKTLMEQFGLTSDQAFDFIAAGYQRGLNSSGDFIDSVNEYSTQFASGGASAEQFFSLLESGMQGGVLGTDKAADAFKEFRLRIIDGSESTKDSLEAIGLSADEITAQIDSGAITVADAFQLVIERLGETEQQSTRSKAAVGLLGTQFEDLGDSAALGLDLTTTKLGDLEGSADKLNAKYQNFGDLFSGIWRKVAVALAPVTDKILELAIEAMPKVDAAIDSLVPVIENLATNVLVPLVKKILEWITAFGNLSPRMQRIVAIGGTLLAALVPILAIMGPLVAGVAAVIGVFTSMGPVLAAAGTAIAALGGPITLIIAAVAGLAAAWSTNFLGIRDKTKAAMEAIGGFIRSGWESIKQWWQGGTQSVESDTDSFWTRTKAAFTSGGESIKSTSQSIWQSISSTAQSAVQAMASGITGAFNGIVSAVQTAFASVRSAIQSAFNFDWSSLGSSVTSGIVNGINRGVGGIISAANNAAQSALNSAKAALQSSSPSRRADREVGITIPQGMARGIRRGMPEVASALRRGIDGVLDVRLPQFGGTPQTKSSAPISIVQNFYGDAERNAVRNAAQLGVRDALRMAGAE